MPGKLEGENRICTLCGLEAMRCVRKYKTKTTANFTMARFRLSSNKPFT